MPVILLSPELCVHLELDVVEVVGAVDLLDVALDHVVVDLAVPVLVVAEVAQLLPVNRMGKVN